MSGNEDDRRMIAVHDLALQVQPVDVRKFHIQHQAGRDVRLRVRHVFRSGAERDRVHIEAREKLDIGCADPVIVVHDENDVVWWVHCESHMPGGFSEA